MAPRIYYSSHSISFAEVCNHLGLSGGAAENPGIKQELDTLEEQHQNGGITEHQSRRAMLVSMGDLRNICERWKNREVLIEPNATAEITVTGQHSPSGLLDKGLNAVGSLRPGPQPRQSSAHTSPIQDNLSDEAHLESSNGFDPSIDHQEGALSTVITDVIPLDTQSHQASHHEYQEQEQTESGLPVSCNLHGYSDDLLSSDIQSYMDFFHPASPGEFDWNEQPVDINVLTS
ncbi:hypothetical protein CSUB01_12565 [Colletotrichum sublineola]|uniref:Uncharacterized protein n=1 Tax=Colletotrichum sublineola TaxID=1173701 RepID=A0A066XN51_COLSU|nr:hypothetical protein CSUB01_12565 [Colletotrichum sublineola]